MPTYLYKCKECLQEEMHVFERNRKPEFLFCNECQHKMFRVPIAPSGTIITEKSPNNGKHIKRGINEELRKRSHQHFKKVEIDDLIAEHGTKMAEDLGWLGKDGRKRSDIDEK